MKTIQTELPETLYNEAAALAQSGWFRDEQEIISEALRRFLESHQPELMEQFIRDDVEWGLHGEDEVQHRRCLRCRTDHSLE